MFINARKKRIFSSLNFLILLFFITNSSVAQIYSEEINNTNTVDTTISELTASHNEDLEADALEEFLSLTLQQLDILDFTLENLALSLNNDAIKVENKKASQRNLLETRAIISELKNKSYVSLSKSDLEILILVNEQIIKRVSKALDTKLETWPVVDFNKVSKRKSSNLDIQALREKLKRGYLKLDELTKKSELFGLTNFQQKFRALEQINENYNLTSKAVKIGLVTLGTGFIIYYLNTMDNKSNKEQISALKKIFVNLKSIIGNPPYYETGNPIPQNLNQLGLFGSIDHTLRRFNVQAIPAQVFSLSIFSYFHNKFAGDFKNFITWLSEKKNNIHSSLRGGPVQDNNALKAKEPNVKFNDVIGADHIKKELTPIVEYIKNTEAFDRGGIPPERGYLFTGLSRSGKSFMATALAGELRAAAKDAKTKRFKFLPISASLIIELGFDTIMNLAQSFAPCVLFIDEIDLLCLQRSKDSSQPNKMLMDLLTWMSGCLTQNNEKQIILLAATNKPESLDFALRQHGRFGKILRFEYPSFEDRLKYLNIELEKRCIIVDSKFVVQLAKETEGCSYDDLGAIIKKALQKAKIAKHAVSEQHFIQSFDEEIRNIVFGAKELNQKEKEYVASYQAGKALANILLIPNQKVSTITINAVNAKLPDEPDKSYYNEEALEYGKIFTYSADKNIRANNQETLINTCKTLLAGHIAQEIILGSAAYDYCSKEQKEAFEITKKIALAGKDLDKLSNERKNKILDQAYDLQDKLTQEVRELLNNNKDTLMNLYNDLLEKHSLSEKEIYSKI